jgi:hypothetical protein
MASRLLHPRGGEGGRRPVRQRPGPSRLDNVVRDRYSLAFYSSAFPDLVCAPLVHCSDTCVREAVKRKEGRWVGGWNRRSAPKRWHATAAAVGDQPPRTSSSNVPTTCSIRTHTTCSLGNRLHTHQPVSSETCAAPSKSMMVECKSEKREAAVDGAGSGAAAFAVAAI